MANKLRRRKWVFLAVAVCLAAVLGTSAIVLLVLPEHEDGGSESFTGLPGLPSYEELDRKILSETKPPEAAKRIVAARRLGRSAIAAGDSDQAREALVALHAVARDYPGTLAAAKALGYAAIFHNALGEKDRALATATASAQACPPESEYLVNCWWHVAKLHQRRGDPARGIAGYREFVQEAEARTYAHADLAHAHLVLMYERFRRFSKALAEYEVFQRKYPKASAEARATALQGLVGSLQALGKKSEALRHARDWAKWAKGTSQESLAERAVWSLEQELGLRSQ